MQVSLTNEQYAKPKTVCLSFTGGKDSTLSLHILSRTPALYNISTLVTFTPTNPTAPFLSHPQSIITLQSLCLSFPHAFLPTSAPYLSSYREHMKSLDVDYFATGDILDVCDNFLGRAAESTRTELLRPLWHRPREEIMEEIFELGFRVMITCIALEKVNEDRAKEFVGKMLDRELYEELKSLDNVDACGEFGEYHTMVLDAPLFLKRIVVTSGSVAKSEDGKFLYFKFEDYRVESKE
ncbi:3020_t:CDS:2 [Paraglomus brasilianum]|uniref:Diphthine--ammonia ligase n=1 Tax=Paraglomus brasilianum TaxID=144538 RepID=A0A9N9FXM9_9GLOM|nr:3020_t:CDS:2 [Paraglomus brasilianum]